jgi:hypothetical protein
MRSNVGAKLGDGISRSMTYFWVMLGTALDLGARYFLSGLAAQLGARAVSQLRGA